MVDAVIEELRKMGIDAVNTLGNVVAQEAFDAGMAGEQVRPRAIDRLSGKIEGVQLMLRYLDEIERRNAQ